MSIVNILLTQLPTSFQAVVPSTFPPTVPSKDGSSDPFFAFSFCHSSGVWHLAVQACIAAISSLSAELTRRCLFNEFLPANSGETIKAEKACPQPPAICDLGFTSQQFGLDNCVQE